MDRKRRSRGRAGTNRRGLSQSRGLVCSSSVDAANESLVEVGLDERQWDLETVFRARYEHVAKVIAGIIRDPGRAEELAVEVFLKWQRTEESRRENAEGWLYRVALRVALNELRRQELRTRYENVLGWINRGRSEATPHDILAALEDRKKIQAALAGMKASQAELLLLRCNDFSYQEIASMLNLNPASVGTLLSRAMEAFRTEFNKRFGARP
jgi:RNA polymerase sigma-70 factor, ECF subfamily